ncbi:MAG: hypothetical protein TR69_WS6001001049 [candidate division WS6 bacterium OLB20]|uniref:MgsA AAA+ ATPase C-terminal domain-containing protein n=1 Tax=candidate division WS6 bacterium OLB20 TaxID=1617426 RepID=A0A136LZF2_9BACT|nr:MAG: hypothetical protein TR69_WS6001001049 [candidate division WS6 bacterium OLB20]
MKQFDYGKGHVRYPWMQERESGERPDQQYLPDNLKDRDYYRPDWK